MKIRSIKRQHPAHRDDIADLSTVRPLPGPDVEQIDPFLFLNHHGRRPSARNNGLPLGRIRTGDSRPTSSRRRARASRLGCGESIIARAGPVEPKARLGTLKSRRGVKRRGPARDPALVPAVELKRRPHYIGMQMEFPRSSPADGKVTVQLGRAVERAVAPIHRRRHSMATIVMQAAAHEEPVAKSRNVFLSVAAT